MAAPGGRDSGGGAREVLAVRYGQRVTSRAESYLNFHLYGEPDAALDIDYFFWVIRDAGGAVTLVDTGFAPEVGDRRRRAHWTTPARALPGLGIAPDDVTTVVISHAHWDHLGNLGEFPRAAIVMAEAEYAFWTSPMAARAQFAAHAEPREIALLASARAEGRITLFTGQYALAPGVDLIEVGGHTPGQLIATVSTGTGSTGRRTRARRCSPRTRCTSTRRSNGTARSRSSPTCPRCTAPTTPSPSWRASRARTWSPVTTRRCAPGSPRGARRLARTANSRSPT